MYQIYAELVLVAVVADTYWHLRRSLLTVVAVNYQETRYLLVSQYTVTMNVPA
jgi:hypothetical protein